MIFPIIGKKRQVLLSSVKESLYGHGEIRTHDFSSNRFQDDRNKPDSTTCPK